MADITMCNNKSCKLSHSCYRFTAKASEYLQTYLMSPKDDCENKDYPMYWKE